MWGATKNNTGGHLKIMGDWGKFKYEGAYKISWGVEKIEEARLSGGCYRGVYSFSQFLQSVSNQFHIIILNLPI